MEDTSSDTNNRGRIRHRTSLTHRSSPPVRSSLPIQQNQTAGLTGIMNNETSSPSVDIDVLLLEEGNNENTSSANDENNSCGAATVISSLPPFQRGEGLKRSISDFSSIGSSVGYILDSNISIDDDLECGPVPDYTKNDLGVNFDETKKKRSNGKVIASDRCPNEVYINTAKAAEHDSSPQTPGKLNAYMGVSRRHKTSEASLGGSSVGSNSLSSIFETIGFSKRSRQPHHSRGLTKKREQGALCHLLTGSTEPRPTSFESEREEILYRKREERMEKLRLSILLMFLVLILIFVTEMSSVDYESMNIVSKPTISSNTTVTKTDKMRDRPEYNPPIVTKNLVKNAVPNKDPKKENAYNVIDEQKNKHDRNDEYLWEQTQYLSDITTQDLKHQDTPFLWSIPESGSRTIREIMSICLSFNVAGEFTISNSNKNKFADSKLQVINLGNHNLINVDVSTRSGVERAKKMNLVPSKMADLIFTPMFLDSMILFDDKHKGRGFTVMRDPIDRAISLFYHLKSIKDPSVENMTLEAYSKSSLIENNWMVRYLSGKIEGDLSPDHLKIAKNVLEKKFIVGLNENMNDSVVRFENYFGVKYKNKQQLGCKNNILTSMKTEDVSITKTNLRKKIISRLEKQNKLDLELFIFGKELYSQQGKHIFNHLKNNKLP